MLFLIFFFFCVDGTLHLPPPDAPLASSGAIPGTPGGPTPLRITFKRLLLNRCQTEFEATPKPEQVAQMLAATPEEERDEKELKIRTRALSNMNFVGELYNKSMLSSKIILNVLSNLVGSMQNPPTDPSPGMTSLIAFFFWFFFGFFLVFFLFVFVFVVFFFIFYFFFLFSFFSK